jgi:hypothetical protein
MKISIGSLKWQMVTTLSRVPMEKSQGPGINKLISTELEKSTKSRRDMHCHRKIRVSSCREKDRAVT